MENKALGEQLEKTVVEKSKAILALLKDLPDYVRNEIIDRVRWERPNAVVMGGLPPSFVESENPQTFEEAQS